MVHRSMVPTNISSSTTTTSTSRFVRRPDYFTTVEVLLLLLSISTITKTASRSVAFKVARLRDAIMQDQDEFITRNAYFEDVAVMANDKAILDDIGFNTDLYIANQEVETQT